jgi:8-oxo-dGTP pyrophosphatase MutT (NUDIX family)
MYRQGTSAFIFNENKEFIIVLSSGKIPFWKIPAGGLELNEDSKKGLLREVKEELGIGIEIIKKSKYTEKFIWPEEVRQNKFKKEGIYYEGQERSVFIAKIKKYQEFNLQKEEISDYKWVNKDNYKQYISIPHQLDFMEQIIEEFKEYF